MKKLRLIIATIVLAVCFTGNVSQAGDAVGKAVFHVENQTGKAGDVIEVPVTMSNGGDVGGFEIEVFYDGDAMTFQSIQKGELIESGGLYDYYNNESKHSVKIVYVTSGTVKADGTIATLTFQLNQDCTEELPIGMTVPELVDDSEESNFISAEVSGVSEAYQKQVEASGIADDSGSAANEAEAGNEDADADGAADTDADSDGEDSGNEEKESKTDEKSEADKAETEVSAKGENTAAYIAAGILAVAVIVTAAGIVVWKKRKDHRR